MRSEYFQQQMERLRRVYSPTSLNEERVKLMWERFKNVSESRFEKALNFVIAEATTQTLPSISRFSEALSFFPESGVGVVNMQDVPPAHRCEACRDTGWDVDGFDRVTGTGMVIACRFCSMGRSMGPAELAKIQDEFNKGVKSLRGKGSIFPELPYDPSRREGA